MGPDIAGPAVAMFENLFKSQGQRDLERRMAFRRARTGMSRALKKLDHQRQQYFVMGRAAAKNGSGDKVRQIARAIQQTNRLERQIEQSRLSLELFETQQDIAAAKAEFSESLKSCSAALLDAEALRAFGELKVAQRQFESDQEEIDALIDTMMDAGRANPWDQTEAEDLRLLEQAMMEGEEQKRAAAAAAARKESVERELEPPAEDAIARDLKELERELNLGA